MRNNAPELDRFANEFCFEMMAKAVERYVSDNYNIFDYRSRLVMNPQGARLEDCRLDFTTNVRTYDNQIGFDAVISADIEVYAMGRGEDLADTISDWFRVPCQVIFEEKLERGRIHGDVEIYCRKEFNKSISAATSRLVPVIYGENYDTEATRFLKKFCPQALETPMPVPLDEIAEAMGLPPIVYEKYLSPDFSVFGKICFADDETTVYDEHGVPERIPAKRGQIFIDPDTYRFRNIGCIRNTIAHELFHWARHRLYATIKRLFDMPHFKSTRCRTYGIIRREGEHSDEEWMEIHANAISPRIIMPAETAKPKAFEFLKQYGYDPARSDSERVLRNVVKELSDFFQVSKQVAMIRLSDFGIDQARDIYENDCERYDTSQVTHTDILREYTENENFRKIVDSGYFRYVEGRFVINDPKYIHKENGGIYLLTDYAREHLDECALRFIAVKTDDKHYGVGHRKNRNYATIKKFIEEAYNLGTAEAWAKASAAFKSEIAYHKKLLAAVYSGASFPESFAALMDIVFDTMEIPEHKRATKFFDITGITDKKYREMRNAAPDYCPTDRTIVGICMAFDLDVSICEKLFEAGGKMLRHTDEHIAFRSMLTVYRGYGVTERNDYLEGLGYGRLNDVK